MDVKKIIRYVYYAVVVLFLVIAMYQIFNGKIQAGSNSGVWQGVIYSLIAAATAVILSAFGLITNPKSLIGFGIGLGVLVVLYYIGKGTATDVVPQKLADQGITLSTIQNSHAGVWASFALFAIAILLAIASGVKSIFNN